MANSSRDPYWQAAVRREMMDHPGAASEIEDECAKCHMPMARSQAMAMGGPGKVFAHLPIGNREEPQDLLAHETSSASCRNRCGVRYIKDNRLLPRGFRKSSAPRDIAVVGHAADDADSTD